MIQNFIWVRSNQKWIIWMWNVGVQVLLMLYELGGNKSLHCLFFYPPADSSTPDPWHLSAPQTCALCVFYNIAWYVSTRFCICICMCICICICICIYIWICICICILFVHLTPERPGDSIVRRASNMFPHNSHFTFKVIHLKKCLQNI